MHCEQAMRPITAQTVIKLYVTCHESHDIRHGGIFMGAADLKTLKKAAVDYRTSLGLILFPPYLEIQ